MLKERVLNLQRQISEQKLHVEDWKRKKVILEAERLLVEEQLHTVQTQVDVEGKARVDCEEGLQRQLIENHNFVLQH